MTADALSPFAVKLPAAIDSLVQRESCAPWRKVSDLRQDHYNDDIMTAMQSQITSVSIV